MLCAPALAKSAMCCSGRSIIRWTSYSTPSKPWSTSALSTCGPIDSGGTKWPSMMSTWMTRAPASTTSATWAPRRGEAGAGGVGGGEGGREDARGDAARLGHGETAGTYRLYLDEHRAATVIADRGRRRGHPHD